MPTFVFFLKCRVFHELILVATSIKKLQNVTFIDEISRKDWLLSIQTSQGSYDSSAMDFDWLRQNKVLSFFKVD